MTQILETVSNQTISRALPNILVVSAVWVLGGFYLHEALVFRPAGVRLDSDGKSA